MDKHRISAMSFASANPLYVQKAESKGRKQHEVDEVISWLTGYSPRTPAEQVQRKTDFDTFFRETTAIHPNADKITGVICGVRNEEIEDPLMRNIRYLDERVDELAKGRPMEKILRTSDAAAGERSKGRGPKPRGPEKQDPASDGRDPGWVTGPSWAPACPVCQCQVREACPRV